MSDMVLISIRSIAQLACKAISSQCHVAPHELGRREIEQLLDECGIRPEDVDPRLLNGILAEARATHGCHFKLDNLPPIEGGPTAGSTQAAR